jgi:hypothetical protein
MNELLIHHELTEQTHVRSMHTRASYKIDAHTHIPTMTQQDHDVGTDPHYYTRTDNGLGLAAYTYDSSGFIPNNLPLNLSANILGSQQC